jgi:hypothetical protein
MKKVSLVILTLVALFITAVYIFIPKRLVISSASSFRANREGVFRFLVSDSNWKKWWPGAISKNKNSFMFTYESCAFQIEEVLYGQIRLRLIENRDSLATSLRVFPLSKDSIGVELSSELDARPNPIRRFSAWLRSRKIRQASDDILSSLRNYTGVLKNIYGMDIQNEKVQYQNLLSTKRSFSHYPTTEDVYALIGELRNYIRQSGAEELFSPMLNVKKADSITYVAQVGIPVDRALPTKDDISLKRMMKGGNILTGEVTGGQGRIEEAEKQMELYISDYQRSIIAIPFQQLITDRTKEPDSTKWITKIFYPVV